MTLDHDLEQTRALDQTIHDEDNAVVAQSKINDSKADNTSVAQYDGASFDPFDRDTWDFASSMENISTALGNICRYGGHVDFYSVAEHSIWVSTILGEWAQPAGVRLLGLWHDSAEYALGDIVRPFKHKMSLGEFSYQEIEERLEVHLFRKYLPGVFNEENWAIVKEADMECYKRERAMRPAPAMSVHGAMPPKAAKYAWLATDRSMRVAYNIEVQCGMWDAS